MMRSWLVGLAVMTGLAGCLRDTEFHCSDDGECGVGVCEDVGFCSFADAGCASGQRFGELAGDLSEQCAPESVTECLGYESVAGLPHLYQVVPARGWSGQRDTCASDGPNAYLAAPQDAGQLTAILGIASQSQLWLGITDAGTEGTFRSVRGDEVTFLPWSAGEPDDGPPSEDCVMVDASSEDYTTERCADAFPAICECEPP